MSQISLDASPANSADGPPSSPIFAVGSATAEEIATLVVLFAAAQAGGHTQPEPTPSSYWARPDFAPAPSWAASALPRW